MAATAQFFIALLVFVISCQAQPPETELFRQAAEHVRNKEYGDAIPLLRQLTASWPGEARYHIDLGFSLWMRHESEEAARELEIAVKLKPGDSVALYYLGRIAEEHDSTDRAIQLYEGDLSSKDVIYDAYLRLAALYIAKGNLARALEIATEAIRQAPWDGSAHYLAGTIYRRTGHIKESEQEFASSRRLNDLDQRFTHDLTALVDASSKKDADRVASLTADILQSSAVNPEVMLSLGIVLGQGGYSEQAVMPLQRAAAAMPESFAANFDLGLTMVRLGRTAESEGPLQRALAILPESFDARRVLGVLYAAEGRNTDAIVALKAALALNPKDSHVAALLGQQYLASGSPGDAVQTIEDAIRIDPADSKLKLLLVQACRSLEKPAAACQGIPQ